MTNDAHAAAAAGFWLTPAVSPSQRYTQRQVLREQGIIVSTSLPLSNEVRSDDPFNQTPPAPKEDSPFVSRVRSNISDEESPKININKIKLSDGGTDQTVVRELFPIGTEVLLTRSGIIINGSSEQVGRDWSSNSCGEPFNGAYHITYKLISLISWGAYGVAYRAKVVLYIPRDSSNALLPITLPVASVADDFAKIGITTPGMVDLSNAELTHVRIETPTEVAVKITDIRDNSSTCYGAALLEGKLLSCIDHPHIVRLIESSLLPPGFTVLVEEFLVGSINRLISDFGPLPEQCIALVIHDVLQALAYLHSPFKGCSIVHRDVKSSNVLLSDRCEAKIIDLGAGAILGTDKNLPLTGTLRWVSPEAIQGVVDTSNDIWAVGLLAYEMATANLPSELDEFQGTPEELLTFIANKFQPTPPPLSAVYRAGQLVSDEAAAPRLVEVTLSENFRNFCAKCFVKDYTQRPSAEELLKHPLFQNVAKKRPQNYRALFASLIRATQQRRVKDGGHSEETKWFRRRSEVRDKSSSFVASSPTENNDSGSTTTALGAWKALVSRLTDTTTKVVSASQPLPNNNNKPNTTTSPVSLPSCYGSGQTTPKNDKWGEIILPEWKDEEEDIIPPLNPVARWLAAGHDNVAIPNESPLRGRRLESSTAAAEAPQNTE